MEEASWKFVQLLLEEAIRVLVPVLITLLAGCVATGIAWLRSKLGEARWAAIEQAVTYAVLAAEQSGLRNAALATGAAKKRLAMEIAQQLLHDRGIKIDATRLGELIEAQVFHWFNRGRVREQ